MVAKVAEFIDLVQTSLRISTYKALKPAVYDCSKPHKKRELPRWQAQGSCSVAIIFDLKYSLHNGNIVCMFFTYGSLCVTIDSGAYLCSGISISLCYLQHVKGVLETIYPIHFQAYHQLQTTENLPYLSLNSRRANALPSQLISTIPITAIDFRHGETESVQLSSKVFLLFACSKKWG